MSTSSFLTWSKGKLKSISNFHRPGKLPDFFLFSMPRSGSTWLMELLATQPGFKFCNEPLYLVNPLVRKYLGISDWMDLYERTSEEKYRNYFHGFRQGRLGFLNPNPFTKFYRVITNRIVFKIIHAGEDRLDWFEKEFNGKIIYLLRHPIAVAISRKKVSNLEATIYSSYGRNFNEQQLSLAKNILETGSLLEKSMVSWCLRAYVPLKNMRDHWAFVTYEQMVLEPEKTIKYLASKLDLKNTDLMIKGLDKPSKVKRLSNEETQRILEQGKAKRSQLVSKWRKKISPEEETKLMSILHVFNIDVYEAGNDLANSKYLIQ